LRLGDAFALGQKDPEAVHFERFGELGAAVSVWQNGKLVQTINGPNTYNDKVGNYFKLGIYKWVWMPEKDKGISTTTEREIFYDDVRIGDESATYNDVAP